MYVTIRPVSPGITPSVEFGISLAWPRLTLRFPYGARPARGRRMKSRRDRVAIAAARDDEHRDRRALDQTRADATQSNLAGDPEAARARDDQVEPGRGLREEARHRIAGEHDTFDRDGVREPAERRVELALVRCPPRVPRRAPRHQRPAVRVDDRDDAERSPPALRELAGDPQCLEPLVGLDIRGEQPRETLRSPLAIPTRRGRDRARRVAEQLAGDATGYGKALAGMVRRADDDRSGILLLGEHRQRRRRRAPVDHPSLDLRSDRRLVEREVGVWVGV